MIGLPFFRRGYWLRRVSWLVLSIASAFLLGIFLFNEKHIFAKGACVIGIILSVMLLS